ncbi:MAG: alpha/beta fold hydrolase [Chloroflexota bacterium]
MPDPISPFQMAYTDRGQGQPVLLIHGYPLNRLLWQPQIEALGDVARLLAPDLRGHGDSPAMAGPYGMDLLADDLNAFLDALGVTRPVVVCGLSMGGYVAFAFYRKYAARMNGLVLTATRSAADSPEARAGRDQAAETLRQRGAAAIVEGMAPRLLAPGTAAEKPELAARLREIMLKTSAEGVLGALAGMRDRPDSTLILGRIALPTLIIHGLHDQIVPLAEAQAMQAAIPGARLEVIPVAGHLPNLENPEAFNQALRQFITSL